MSNERIDNLRRSYDLLEASIDAGHTPRRAGEEVLTNLATQIFAEEEQRLAGDRAKGDSLRAIYDSLEACVRSGDVSPETAQPVLAELATAIYLLG